MVVWHEGLLSANFERSDAAKRMTTLSTSTTSLKGTQAQEKHTVTSNWCFSRRPRDALGSAEVLTVADCAVPKPVTRLTSRQSPQQGAP